MVRVEVKPALLRWARERAKIEHEALLKKFPKLIEWETERTQPTLKQLESYAKATHTPVGFLLLEEPPDEPLPIPDYRTVAGQVLATPSADLLDTIYICERRQEWYRDYVRGQGEEPLDFVGSLSASTRITEAAANIRDSLGFNMSDRERYSTWSAALVGLVERAEDAGILVMISGIVGSNTYRKLDPGEFRGFALSDPHAPLVFINGADTKAAQIFTLMHELAHIWLGQHALDDANVAGEAGSDIERWCSEVAAELLVPLDQLTEQVQPWVSLTEELERLARVFKVSTLVILRRIHDAGRLSWDDYWRAHRDELDRVLQIAGERESLGGNFYNTTPVRASKRFSRALITSTLEGHTLYRDAVRLLGFRKLSTLDELVHRLGVT